MRFCLCAFTRKHKKINTLCYLHLYFSVGTVGLSFKTLRLKSRPIHSFRTLFLCPKVMDFFDKIRGGGGTVGHDPLQTKMVKLTS